MMSILNTKTNNELMMELGRRLQRQRLQQNLRQSDLAHQTGLSRTTISMVEGGHDPRLSSVIKILRALNLLHALDAFLPDPGVSPMALLKLNKPQRQRARRRAPESRSQDSDPAPESRRS